MDDDKKQKKPSGAIWLLVPIAGIALELGFENIPLSGFAFLISGVPLLAFLYACKNKIHAFLGGWLAGFVFFALNFRWFLTVYPLDWAGIKNNYEAMAVIIPGWLLSAAALALGIALFSLLFKILKTNTWHDVLLAPFFWILCEYIRPYFFEGLWWSPDGLFGPHWTNGSLGLLLLDTPLKNIAKIGGVYGLSFCAFFINITAIFLFAGKRIAVYEQRRVSTHDQYSRIFALLLMGLFIFSPFTVGKFYKNQSAQGQEWYVSALQVGNQKALYSVNDLSKLATTDVALHEYPDLPHLIVLPEGIKVLVFKGPEEDKVFNDLFAERKADGLLITGGNKMGRTVTIYKNTAGENLSEQAKLMLMPGGEYVPSALQYVMDSIGKRDSLDGFARIRKTSKAEKPEEIFTSGTLSIGTLSCSGILSSNLYRRLANQGATLLVNQASYGLFKQDAFILGQVTAMSRIQALANNRYFVQSAARGKSFVVDPSGDIIAEGSLGNEQFVHAVVRPMTKNTLFVSYGNWIVFVALAILLIRATAFAIVRVRLSMQKRADKKKEAQLLNT